MSERGDLLELLSGAQEPFRTLRAVYATWRHQERATAAFTAIAEARGASLVTFSEDRDSEPQRERTGLTRMWREGERMRVEREGERRGYDVRAGELWWSWSPQLGAVSNEDDREVGSGAGEELRELLDPTLILGALRFEVLGARAVAGRATIAAEALPRHGPGGRERSPRDSFALHALGAGAERYLLDADAERGVLLRVEAFRGGEPFQRTEAVEIAFDEPLEHDLFVFRAPAGERVLSPRERHGRPEHVPVSQAQRRAPFTVLLPERVPADWELHCTYVGPSERPPSGPSVHLSYTSASGHESVSIGQRSAAEERRPGDAGGWEELRLDGALFHVRTLGRRQTQLRLEREGTAVDMVSSSLERDGLARLATRLVSAPPESGV
jgi:hypothetical protein